MKENKKKRNFFVKKILGIIHGQKGVGYSMLMVKDFRELQTVSTYLRLTLDAKPKVFLTQYIIVSLKLVKNNFI